jgi:glutamate racemase
LVIACNTASAVAVDALSLRFAPIPVVGVIEPGAAAACAASRSGHIAVIATEGTVRGGAYQQAITRLRADAVVRARACSLFVALAEEGWFDDAIVEAVAHRYLDEMFRADPRIDTLLLGCTHFPVLSSALRKVVGASIAIVDSAATTASVLRQSLQRQSLVKDGLGETMLPPSLMASDSPERFALVGSRFLGEAFTAENVELVDLAPPLS